MRVEQPRVALRCLDRKSDLAIVALGEGGAVALGPEEGVVLMFLPVQHRARLPPVSERAELG